MSYRFLAFAATMLSLSFSQPVAGQNAAMTTKAWTPPATPDGHPDLQGVWSYNSVIPLQRPTALGAKEFYTEEELAANMKRERERLNKTVEEGPTTQAGTAADVHYDFSQFGLDRAQTKIARNIRTSIIIGPDGRIPPLTPEASKRAAERAALAKGHEFDGPEDRPMGARCIARANVGPPLMPEAYNSNLQIFQTPGYVAIETEMIHDVRMIPTDGRPHLSPSIRLWMGDSVGHWEGKTLVVDSTNFTNQNPYVGAENLHVIERLTRTDEGTILYQYTVEDPGLWTKPWSGELAFGKLDEQLYEYACHEANYGLANTLRGARVAEAESAAKKSAQ